MRSDADLLYSRVPEDFGVFYARHVAAVTAYVARCSPGPELTFDLVAETFARALVHRERFDPRRTPATTWLLGIARHLMSDALRHGHVADAARVRLAMEPIALDDEQLEGVVEAGRNEFAEALEALPESQRIAVMRRVLGEDEHEPLGPRVAGSGQVVRRPVAHGLAALRQRLEAR